MTLEEKVAEIVDDFAREYKGLSPSTDAWEQYTAMKERAAVKVRALIAADRAALVEALKVARMQIDYLDTKLRSWQQKKTNDPMPSTVAVIAKIDKALEVK